MDTSSPRVTLVQVLNGVGQVAVLVGALCLACGALGIPLRRPETAYLTLLVGLLCYLGVALRTGDGRRVLRQALGSAVFGAAMGAVIRAGGLVRAGNSWLTVALLCAVAAAMVGCAKLLLRSKANEGR
jgi:1,4-dihydroxy-2-naphthoate octaprenyltransferase